MDDGDDRGDVPVTRTRVSPAEAAIAELATSLAAHGARGVRVAFVLGSGLGAFADALDHARAIPFESLEGMPRAGVKGHAGRIVLGSVEGIPVLAQQGRVHFYEGHSAAVVTRSVRAYARLGVEVLVLTNAAGGLVTAWPIPTLMRLDDHIDLQGRSSLGLHERGVGSPYDAGAGATLDEVAASLGVGLQRGVYAGLLGPSYETPAEIRHLARMGAHAVGMSTVAEAAVGAAEGMRVAAISCISNAGAGLAPGALNHEEVVAAGRMMAADFTRLLRGSVRPLTGGVSPRR